MQYRRLGNGPLEVSELSFGTWLTVAGGVGREQAIRCIHAAVDCGITLFDTANQYGAGAAERVLGEALRATPRDRYLIATKLFFPVGDEPDKGLSAAQVEKQLDRSLERLGVDCIDLYQCHRFDKETPVEETLGALDKAVRAGKVRAIGFSEWTAAQIDEAAAIAAELGLTMAQMALAWVLRRAEVASAIIGASRPEQVVDNVRAVGVRLPDEVLERIDRAVGGVVVGG